MSPIIVHGLAAASSPQSQLQDISTSSHFFKQLFPFLNASSPPCGIERWIASLAQLVEHALRKRTVAGSIPAGGLFILGLRIYIIMLESQADAMERTVAAQPMNGDFFWWQGVTSRVARVAEGRVSVSCSSVHGRM